MFIHKNKLFKLLVSYSIAAMGLNLFLVLAGNIHFDINVLLFSSLLWGLEAAETAVVLFLFIVTANCLAIINIKQFIYFCLIDWRKLNAKHLIDDEWKQNTTAGRQPVAACRNAREARTAQHLFYVLAAR